MATTKANVTISVNAEPPIVTLIRSMVEEAVTLEPNEEIVRLLATYYMHADREWFERLTVDMYPLSASAIRQQYRILRFLVEDGRIILSEEALTR